MDKRCRNFDVIPKNEHLSSVWNEHENREIPTNDENLHVNVGLSD